MMEEKFVNIKVIIRKSRFTSVLLATGYSIKKRHMSFHFKCATRITTNESFYCLNYSPMQFVRFSYSNNNIYACSVGEQS
jgi:hypothetical protein